LVSKQRHDNPWASFTEKFPVGSTVEGEVKNANEFGLFIEPTAMLTAWSTCPTSHGYHWRRSLLHLSPQGRTVKAISDIDAEKESAFRLTSSLKRVPPSAVGAVSRKRFEEGWNHHRANTVLEVRDGGLEVQGGVKWRNWFPSSALTLAVTVTSNVRTVSRSVRSSTPITGFNRLKAELHQGSFSWLKKSRLLSNMRLSDSAHRLATSGEGAQGREEVSFGENIRLLKKDPPHFVSGFFYLHTVLAQSRCIKIATQNLR
jgi:hypothetical protein